ncbi:biotin transporter BioY [Pseudoramibacter porci]|uniref:Biotin transporter n=1 Tax=Pseudoramibacter porci TaxID=2606631 RepID=A0A7X2NFU6_9FIRM|nr:biotin transporter BioY [Pseudoramibacter porci]MSS19694.1 biotin transporter BioY [Pseudoramibacter porci]
MSTKPKTRNLVFTALLAAFMAILGPLSIPLPGGVPLSPLTFALFLSAYLLGWRFGTLAVAVYLLLGFFGVPVFSGFTAGAGRLLGPTGGYLIGYILAALIAGKLCETRRKFIPALISMLIGSIACLALGTVWFMLVTHTALIPALLVCVVPFIPGDIAKMAAAAAVGRILDERLARSGLSIQKFEAGENPKRRV